MALIKRTILLSLNTLLLIAAVVAVSSLKRDINDEGNGDNIGRASYVATENRYILKDYNGKLALFRNNETLPIKVFTVFTENLPDDDSNEMLAGISVFGEQELQQLLEDYLS